MDLSGSSPYLYGVGSEIVLGARARVVVWHQPPGCKRLTWPDGEIGSWLLFPLILVSCFLLLDSFFFGCFAASTVLTEDAYGDRRGDERGAKLSRAEQSRDRNGWQQQLGR